MKKSAELQNAIGVGWRMGDMMGQYYTSPQLAEFDKDERGTIVAEGSTAETDSIVTEADLQISDWVVAFYAQYGRGVVSEERGRSALYGSPDAEYLDPIDGTRNFAQARRHGFQSLAGFSLGSVVGGRIVRGVANFPLMVYPRLYWAEEGLGAYRMTEEKGEEKQVVVNGEPTAGAVLVSDTSDIFSNSLIRQGFRPVRLGGAVFKACAVADSQLVHAYDPDLLLPDEEVVGFISHRTSAHDYVGAAAIVRAAGGVACSLDGGELSLQAGKHGCIVANNEATRDRLLETAYSSN